MARIPFLRLVNRLTGFSTPIFGVSWNPPALDAEVAKRVITTLEDRRVLFAPEELEIPHHTIESVLMIRELLTDALTEVDRSSQLGGSLVAMRGACRAFLDQMQALRGDERSYFALSPFEQWILGAALGEIRAIFGVHIGQIAVAYGIDLEAQLVQMLPAEDDEPESKR